MKEMSDDFLHVNVFQRFKKSRSRGQKGCVSEHILCSPGIGAEPQQARKIPGPPTAVRVFFVFVGTKTLLASLQCV